VFPFDLPPPVPIYEPAPAISVEQPLFIAKEKEKPLNISPEEQNFHSAVSNFQQHLSKLSPKHKAEIRKIHTQVTQWANKQRAAGNRADKLSTFAGKVMSYADGYLEKLEKADPELKQFKVEHKQFQDLFLAGNQLIEAYLAWVRTDHKAKDQPLPRKV
jgi:uncharacterized coiled-coil DUF342 family protein